MVAVSAIDKEVGAWKGRTCNITNHSRRVSMKRNFFKLLPVLLIGFTLTLGCGKKMVSTDISDTGSDSTQQAEVVPDNTTATEQVQSSDISSGAAAATTGYASLKPGDGLTEQAEKNGTLFAVHFDYDKYIIRDEDKPILDNNAKWLNLNSKVRITIEGHADERGETEYNLALGDKRAKSVEKYLEAHGVKADRLSTISYGEEKPVDPGHAESAWSKNRRAEFRITAN